MIKKITLADLFNKLTKNLYIYVLFVGIAPDETFNLENKDWICETEDSLKNTPHAGQISFFVAKNTQDTETIIRLKSIGSEGLVEIDKANIRHVLNFCLQNDIFIYRVIYSRFFYIFSDSVFLYIKNRKPNKILKLLKRLTIYKQGIKCTTNIRGKDPE